MVLTAVEGGGGLSALLVVVLIVVEGRYKLHTYSTIYI